MPKRIQRKRTKGWRMPEGAVYVGRPTKFGNPFVVGKDGTAEECIEKFREWLLPESGYIQFEALRLAAHLADLEGKDLACWCALDQPCHADVLLEMANGDDDA